MVGVETAAVVDWRRPETREELFQRFYQWALTYKSHPGGVYYVLPYVADKLGWDMVQRTWAAWIQGNTQNPVTTLMLMEAGDRPQKADLMLNWFLDHRESLAWDTDRRYHRKAFVNATLDYLRITERRGQLGHWEHAARGGWPGCWAAANNLPTMGRLSSWSYLEYLRLLGVGIPDAETLMLGDMAGSRSHRNGLALVMGREDLMWWKRNPGSGAHLYTREVLEELAAYGRRLRVEARRRNPGHPDVGYLTLESALCTFKGWHVPNRRYTGVYNDLLYDRIKSAEDRHGRRFDVLWDARAAALPSNLLMEARPDDPGCVPVKQNHFLDTGRPPVIGYDYLDMGLSDFDQKCAAGAFRKERRWP